MTYVRFLGIATLVASLAVAGCNRTDPARDKLHKEEEDHAHGKGPSGGVIFHMGRYHAEFTVDHEKKQCAVLFVGGDDEHAKPLPVEAKELTVSTKETKTKKGEVVPALTIKLLPTDAADGKAARFVGSDPGLGNVADFEGTVQGEIAGKPSSGKFKE